MPLLAYRLSNGQVEPNNRLLWVCHCCHPDNGFACATRDVMIEHLLTVHDRYLLTVNSVEHRIYGSGGR